MMFLVNSNRRHFLNNYFTPFLWGAWIIILILVLYKTRYWINHDTIGSLDSARYFKHFQLKEAFNAYWGAGYALLLSLLPLDNAMSWFQVHLLVGLLVLISQLLIYKGLIYLNVRKSLAAVLAIIWGATNFSTGGALYITADPALCFFGSIFVFVALKTGLAGTVDRPGNAALLGTIHGFAWMTKTVALPGLILFPVLIFLRGMLSDDGSGKGAGKLGRWIKFIVIYSLPLLILISLWGVGSYGKYGRVTLSEASSYNYALYIEQSEQLRKAKEEARHNLPPYGTYFWSDIGSSLSGWDYKIHFNFKDQLHRAWGTVGYFFVSENIRDGCVIFLLFVLSLLGCIVVPSPPKEYSLLIILAAVGWSIIFIYSSVLLISRYLPFAVVFFMPMCGVFIEQLMQKRKKVLNVFVFTILLFGILHGFGSMLYTSFFLAPGGEHFVLAEKLRAVNDPQKSPGPIGAFLGSYGYTHHHAVIANLLKVQAAEIRPMGTEKSHFTATFSPNTILLAASPRESAPAVITVNQRHYKKIDACFWGRGSKWTQIIIYQ